MKTELGPYALLRSSLADAPASETQADPAEAIAVVAAAILRRWKLILLVLVTMLGCAYVAVQMMSDSYEVEASLLMRVGRENLEVPTVLTAGSLVSTGVRKEDINSDVGLLGSRSLIERTVDEIGVQAFLPEPPPPVTLLQRVRRTARNVVTVTAKWVEAVFIELRLATGQTPRDKLVSRLEDRLYARRDGESDVVLVTLRWGNPDIAVRFLQRHIENFLVQRAVARRSLGAEDYFVERADAADAELAAIDTRIEEMRSARDLSSVSEERDNLLQRVTAIDRLLTSARMAASAASSLEPFVPGDRGGEEAGGGASPDAIRTRLGELVIARASMLEDFSASGKPLRDIEGQIGQLTALLGRSAASEISMLTRERDAAQQRLAILNDGELKLDRLFLERDLARTRYGDFVKQREAARVSSELERRRVANMAVLTPPTKPAAPSAPRKLMIVLASIPLGLVVGIVLAAVLAYLDQRIFTLRELSRMKGFVTLGGYRSDPAMHG